MEIDAFENTEIAFANKTNRDLNRLHWMFRLVNYKTITQAGIFLVNSAVKMKLPIKKLIKMTLFRQFCAGETLEESENIIQQLAALKMGVILDYAVEAEEGELGFAEAEKQIFIALERAQKTIYPFVAVKITSIAEFALLQKITLGDSLSESEKAKWQKVQERLNNICQKAFDLNVSILIDAEESWIQDAIDHLTNIAMETYNKEKVIVFNTFQLYRKDRLFFLQKSQQNAQEKGYFLGAKLVRGAYLEKERNRAKKLGNESPIHENKESTDKDYNKGLEFCINHLENIALFAGTHNEASLAYLTQLIEAKKTEKSIYFGQLYGMGDHLSYNLAHFNYKVLKVLPYGPVMFAIPYLLRRAEENSSIWGQMSRELSLIIKEKKRRKTCK